MSTTHATDSKQIEKFQAVYDRRRRASLDDARHESEMLVAAVKRISDSAGKSADTASQCLAAGKLFEIAGELIPAEANYRRAFAAKPELIEAGARLAVTLVKQRRFDEAIQLGSELLLKTPDAVIESLIYQGPLSLCTIVADGYRLSGDFAAAAALYREAARLEGGTPLAVGQAAVSMALAGEVGAIDAFVAKHPRNAIGERFTSALRVGHEADALRATIKQVARRANVAAAESMALNFADPVINPA